MVSAQLFSRCKPGEKPLPILNYSYMGRVLVLLSLAAYSTAAAWFGVYRFSLALSDTGFKGDL